MCRLPWRPEWRPCGRYGWSWKHSSFVPDGSAQHNDRGTGKFRLSVRLRLVGRRHVGLFLAAFQPHVIDGMLDGVEARALRKHPSREDAANLAVERDLVHLHEGVRL